MIGKAKNAIIAGVQDAAVNQFLWLTADAEDWKGSMYESLRS